MKSIHILCIIALTTVSCSHNIDITDYIDPTQSFQVRDFAKIISPTVESEIQVKDLKHEQLLSWLELNNQNWIQTNNRHAALIIIHQDKFRLLYYRNHEYVVVILTDDDNVLHSYKQIVDTDGLIFLDKK